MVILKKKKKVWVFFLNLIPICVMKRRVIFFFVIPLGIKY